MKVKYSQTQYEDGRELVMVEGYVEREFNSPSQAREWISGWFGWKGDFVRNMGIDIIDCSPDGIVWTGSGIVFVEAMTIEE